MVAITDYDSLQTNLQSWLWNRADVVAQIPTFIQMFEAQANRTLRTRDMRAQNDTFSVTGEFVSVPADFIGARSFTLDSSPPIHLDFAPDDDQIENMKQYRTDNTGNPTTYAVIGSSFQFYPVPTAAINGHLRYWQRIASLSVSATTNWLLTKHPDFYLYGALLQSAPWLRDSDQIAVWSAAYQAILDQITTNDIIETSAPRVHIPAASVVV